MAKKMWCNPILPSLIANGLLPWQCCCSIGDKFIIRWAFFHFAQKTIGVQMLKSSVKIRSDYCFLWKSGISLRCQYDNTLIEKLSTSK